MNVSRMEDIPLEEVEDLHFDSSKTPLDFIYGTFTFKETPIPHYLEQYEPLLASVPPELTSPFYSSEG